MLYTYGNYYRKTTRNHGTMSTSSLCSSVQVSLLQLMDPSISFTPNKATSSTLHADPSTPCCNGENSPAGVPNVNSHY